MIISFCWIPPTLASTANSCSCSDQDLPITVDAGLETMHVIGGTTLQLTGTVDNPNVPDNLYTVVPSYTWSIINYGGLAAGTFNLSNPNSSITSLTTPKVTDTTIIIVRLEAEEWDCSCWDDVAITILPENSSSRSCSIYYATEDDQTGAIAGSKEKVNLSSSTAEVSLTAIIADFTSPVIRWTSSSGLLLNPYSANPVLNISGIRPSGTPVNVGLTVYEADNPDIFAFTNTFFVFGYRSENYSDDISIECTFNGITDSVKDGDLIVKEMDAATIQLQLQGFADEYADPKFSWEAGSNARLSETTGKTTLLTVSTPSDEIVVPVYLTVEENDGTDNNSISIYFILLGIEAGQPTEPIIEVFPSLEVTPGTQVKLKANAISSTGMSADRLSYRWDIQTLEGTKIDFLQNGRESIFSVPSLEEGA